MITRFSAMAPEDVAAYKENFQVMKQVAGFMEPAEDFDEYGLRFPAEYLNNIGHYVVFMPLEYMAQYADVITTQAVDEKDEEFLWNQIINEDINVEQIYDSINATAIGNLAYVCLKSHSDKAREITEKILNEIFVITKGKMLNQINESL